MFTVFISLFLNNRQKLPIFNHQNYNITKPIVEINGEKDKQKEYTVLNILTNIIAYLIQLYSAKNYVASTCF